MNVDMLIVIRWQKMGVTGLVLVQRAHKTKIKGVSKML